MAVPACPSLSEAGAWPLLPKLELMCCIFQLPQAFARALADACAIAPSDSGSDGAFVTRDIGSGSPSYAEPSATPVSGVEADPGLTVLSTQPHSVPLQQVPKPVAALGPGCIMYAFALRRLIADYPDVLQSAFPVLRACAAAITVPERLASRTGEALKAPFCCCSAGMRSAVISPHCKRSHDFDAGANTNRNLDANSPSPDPCEAKPTPHINLNPRRAPDPTCTPDASLSPSPSDALASDSTPGLSGSGHHQQTESSSTDDKTLSYRCAIPDPNTVPNTESHACENKKKRHKTAHQPDPNHQSFPSSDPDCSASPMPAAGIGYSSCHKYDARTGHGPPKWLCNLIHSLPSVLWVYVQHLQMLNALMGFPIAFASSTFDAGAYCWCLHRAYVDPQEGGGVDREWARRSVLFADLCGHSALAVVCED